MDMLARQQMVQAPRVGKWLVQMQLLEDFSDRPGDHEKWIDLWSCGVVVVCVLGVTSSIAALILRFLGTA
jgi:hypothetical protein